jgi:tetratricopeptide (TPR) repeat protein
MILKKKTHKLRSTKQIKRVKLLCISCLVLLFSLPALGQDSIALPEDLNEEKELKFQKYFFKALSEKAIHKYQKAIENLESCHQILPNNVAVFFEFSKNYYALNNTQLAKEYIDRALVKDPENRWMLKHLVAVLQRSNLFDKAIEVQEKMVGGNPKDIKPTALLSRLYLRNNQPEKALELLKALEEKNGLSSSLQQLKDSLEKRNSRSIKEVKPIELDSPVYQFESDKTYASLEKVLKNAKSEAVLLKYSEQGIQLFPAQPYVYLVQGKVLNNQKSYKKALAVLKSGVDFVIDDEQENDFFREMIKSYKGMGNILEEKKYLKKLNKH